MTTTTRKEDYLGRDLVNEDPGTSDATDYAGRSVIASNKDYLGRSLTVAPWVTLTAYTTGTSVYIADGAELLCTTAGTSGASEPEDVGDVGDAVENDGTVDWVVTEAAPA